MFSALVIYGISEVCSSTETSQFPIFSLNCSILTAVRGRTGVCSKFKISTLVFRTRTEHFSQVEFSTEHSCFVTVTVKIKPNNLCKPS